MAAGFERGSGLFGRGPSEVASCSGTRLGIRTKPEVCSISGSGQVTRRVPELQASAGSQNKVHWSRNVSRRHGA